MIADHICQPAKNPWCSELLGSMYAECSLSAHLKEGHARLAGWWAETGAWVPRDWALRPSYDTRVAIINAMYACGENVQKLMPVLLTEAVRRDRQASPLSLFSRAISQQRLFGAAQVCCLTHGGHEQARGATASSVAVRSRC